MQMSNRHKSFSLAVLAATALAALPGSAGAQQYRMQRSNSISLSGLFFGTDGINPGSDFGTNPFGLAYDAASGTAFVGGFNSQAAVGNVGVVRIGDAISASPATAALSASTFATSAQRGVNGLASFGGDVFVSHVNPEVQPHFVRRLNGTTGATIWNVDTPGGWTPDPIFGSGGALALEVDPRGAGAVGSGTLGLGFMTQAGSGGGSRHVLDLANGSLLYASGATPGSLGGGAGVFNTAGPGPADFGNRDIDFDPNGNFARATGDGFDYAVRFADQSFVNTSAGNAGSTRILQKRLDVSPFTRLIVNDIGTAAEFVAGVGTSQFLAVSSRISGAPIPTGFAAADTPFALLQSDGATLQFGLDARNVLLRNIDGTRTGLVQENLTGSEDFFTGAFTADIKEFASGTDANGNPVLMVLSFAERRLDIYQVEPTWNTASGDWDTAGNWAFNLIGNGATQNARFNQAAAPTTVTLNTNKTTKLLKLESTNSYTFSGTGTLTTDAPDGKGAHISVTAGSHTIAVPVVANKGTDLRVPTGSTLTLSGGVSGAGITKRGLGQVDVRSFRMSATNVAEGVLRVSQNGGTLGASRTGDLAIANDGFGTFTAKLDITNNGLVVATTPFADVLAMLLAGRNGGNYTGNGLTSSSAAANPGFTAIGIANAGELGLTSFLGLTVTATDTLVRYTRQGDADLSGAVSLDDFTRLAASFGGAGGWSKGDFNFTGNVDLDDFTVLAANFGQSAPADLARASVPEPTSLALAAIGTIGLLRRRRA